MYNVTDLVLRAMAIMYLAESPLTPDLDSDYYLSPILAPNAILAKFPKTFIICGERDPLVDDTVIFANRIRQAKARYFESAEGHVRVKILAGLSHGFLLMYGLLPEARQAVRLTGDWMVENFTELKTEKIQMNQVEEKMVFLNRRKEIVGRMKTW
jgi:acetyl esterase/lipase